MNTEHYDALKMHIKDYQLLRMPNPANTEHHHAIIPNPANTEHYYAIRTNIKDYKTTYKR